MTRALCFVLMPAGGRPPPDGRVIDVERIYDDVFAPAIREAGLEPFREHPHMTLGISGPAFERLLLCEYALADLTLASADVFYQLGARDAARPRTTVYTCAEGGLEHAFDVKVLDAVGYRLMSGGAPAEPVALRASIVERLQRVQQRSSEMPLLDLLEDYPHVAHEKTDVFLARVPMPDVHRQEIARRAALPPDEALRELTAYEAALGELASVESGVVVALFLAYRDLESYTDMIRLADAMPRPVSDTLLMREQYAFALNRLGRSREAEALLEHLLATRGPSSETYALLGRVYKDRYDGARARGEADAAEAWLARAADTYLEGFEADTRDDYPGVNAVTLLALRDRADPRIPELLAAVRYAARRRVAAGNAGYWSHAALLELAILADDESDARLQLTHAVSQRPESWKVESTVRNLKLLQHANIAPAWAESLMDALAAIAKPRQP